MWAEGIGASALAIRGAAPPAAAPGRKLKFLETQNHAAGIPKMIPIRLIQDFGPGV